MRRLHSVTVSARRRTRNTRAGARWLGACFDGHADVGIGADARGPALLIIDRQPGQWRVRQILDDPAGDHDWGFDFEVDLAASDEQGVAVLRLVGARRMDQRLRRALDGGLMARQT